MTTSTASIESIVAKDWPVQGVHVQEEVRDAIDNRIEEINQSLSFLRCIADSLNARLDDNPGSVDACNSLEAVIVKLAEARDGLEFVELMRSAAALKERAAA
jgi:hypothetical protein